MLDHPGAIRVPTGAPKWPKTAPKWPRMAQNHQNGSKWHCMTLNDPKHFPWVYSMIICHVGPPWALFRGPRGPHNGPKQHQPRMAQNHQNGSKCHCMTPNDPKHFQWVYNMIICHVGPPWALFRGPRGPHNDPKQHQKWSFVTKNGPS